MSTSVASASSLEGLCSRDGIPPSAGIAELTELHREMLDNRHAAFVALMLRLSTDDRRPKAATEAFARFVGQTRETRMTLVGDPAFSIWLQGATRRLRRGDLAETAAEFPTIFSRCLGRLAVDDLELGAPNQLLRYDVDPLLAAVAPPTYTFPTGSRAYALEQQTTYRLDVFRDVAQTALGRIADVWPGIGAMFPAFVRTVVHLPYATFRSASASRYNGVIFLTADDRTILEVEESMVHEWGHQLLYAAMELDPLVLDGDRGDIALPWSGARRDFYGYFHALFVYVLLLRYLERIANRDAEEMERIAELFAHILRGATRAVADFQDDSSFTERGRLVRDFLIHAVELRAAANPDLLGGDAP